MRTRNEINKDLKTSMVNLNQLVEDSVNHEQSFKEESKNLESHIRALDTEISFEDTLTGQSYELTVVAKRKIKNLLHELEQKTGITLQIQFVSESKSVQKPFLSIRYQKSAFKTRLAEILMNPRYIIEERIDKIWKLVNGTL